MTIASYLAVLQTVAVLTQEAQARNAENRCAGFAQCSTFGVTGGGSIPEKCIELGGKAGSHNPHCK